LLPTTTTRRRSIFNVRKEGGKEEGGLKSVRLLRLLLSQRSLSLSPSLRAPPVFLMPPCGRGGRRRAIGEARRVGRLLEDSLTVAAMQPQPTLPSPATLAMTLARLTEVAADV
jgi:hypothetical protein